MTHQQQALPLAQPISSTAVNETEVASVDMGGKITTTQSEAVPQSAVSEAMPFPEAPEVSARPPVEEGVRQPPTPVLEDQALLRSISRVSTMTIPAPLLYEKTEAESPPAPVLNKQATRYSIWEDVADEPLKEQMYDPPESAPPLPDATIEPSSSIPAPVQAMSAPKQETPAETNLWSRLQSLKPISRTVTVTEVGLASRYLSLFTSAEEPQLTSFVKILVPGQTSRAVTEPSSLVSTPAADARAEPESTQGKLQATALEPDGWRRMSTVPIPISSGENLTLESAGRRSTMRSPMADLSYVGAVPSRTATLRPNGTWDVSQVILQEDFQQSPVATPPPQGQEISSRRASRVQVPFRDTMESEFSRKRSSLREPVGETIVASEVISSADPATISRAATGLEQEPQRESFRSLSRSLSNAITAPTTARQESVVQRMPSVPTTVREYSLESAVSPLEDTEQKQPSRQDVVDGPQVSSVALRTTSIPDATANMAALEQDVQKRVSIDPVVHESTSQGSPVQSIPAFTTEAKNEPISETVPLQQSSNEVQGKSNTSPETGLPRAPTIVEQDALRRASRLLSKVWTSKYPSVAERAPTMGPLEDPAVLTPPSPSGGQSVALAVGLDTSPPPVTSVEISEIRLPEELPTAPSQVDVQHEETAILGLESFTVPLSQQPTRRRTETEEEAIRNRHTPQPDVQDPPTRSVPPESVPGAQKSNSRSTPLRNPSLYFDVDTTLSPRLPRAPTLPSPEVPDRPIQRNDKRQSTRKERENSTVTERSPGLLPVAYTKGPLCVLDALLPSVTGLLSSDTSSYTSAGSVSATSTSEIETDGEDDDAAQKAEWRSAGQWKWLEESSSTLSTSGSSYSTSSVSSDCTLAHSSSPPSVVLPAGDNIDDASASSTYSEHPYDPVIRRTTTITSESPGRFSEADTRPYPTSCPPQSCQASAGGMQTVVVPLQSRPRLFQSPRAQQRKGSVTRWLAPSIVSNAKPSTWTRPSRWHLEGVYDGLGCLNSWTSVQLHRGGNGSPSISAAGSKSTAASRVDVTIESNASTTSGSETTADAASVIVRKDVLATEHWRQGIIYNHSPDIPSERSGYITASASTSTTDLVNVSIVDVLTTQSMHPHLLHSVSVPELRGSDATGAVARLPPRHLRSPISYSALPMSTRPLQTSSSFVETLTLDSGSTGREIGAGKKVKGRKMEGKLRIKRLWVSLGLACYLLE